MLEISCTRIVHFPVPFLYRDACTPQSPKRRIKIASKCNSNFQKAFSHLHVVHHELVGELAPVLGVSLDSNYFFKKKLFCGKNCVSLPASCTLGSGVLRARSRLRRRGLSPRRTLWSGARRSCCTARPRQSRCGRFPAKKTPFFNM